MKYLSTVEILDDVFIKLQNDINYNAFKYIKGKKIKNDLIIKAINCKINKSIKEPWIDKLELLDLIDRDKINIQVITDSNNKILKYILTNKKGKQIFISNAIKKISYNFIDDNVQINIILPIEGDFLDFSYLFQNKNILSYNLDLSSLKTMVALLNGYNYNEDKQYHYGW